MKWRQEGHPKRGGPARFAFFWPSLRPFKYSGTQGYFSHSCVSETSRSTVLTCLRPPLALVSLVSISIGVTLVKKLVSFLRGQIQVGFKSLGM